MKKERIPIDGAKVRERREQRGMSTAELAARMRVSYGRMAAWEAGAEGIWPEQLYTLSTLLRCRMKDLLTDETEATYAGM